MTETPDTPNPESRWSAAVLGRETDYSWPAVDEGMAHQIAQIQSAEYVEPVLVWDGSRSVAGYVDGQPVSGRPWEKPDQTDRTQHARSEPADPVAAALGKQFSVDDYFFKGITETRPESLPEFDKDAPLSRPEGWGPAAAATMARSEEVPPLDAPPLDRDRVHKYLRDQYGPAVDKIGTFTASRSEEAPRVDLPLAEEEIERQIRLQLAGAGTAFTVPIGDATMFLYRDDTGSGDFLLRVEGRLETLHAVERVVARVWDWRATRVDATVREWDVTAAVMNELAGPGRDQHDDTVDAWQPAGPLQSFLAAPLVWTWLVLAAVLIGIGSVANGALWRLLGALAALSLLVELVLRQQRRDNRRR